MISSENSNSLYYIKSVLENGKIEVNTNFGKVVLSKNNGEIINNTYIFDMSFAMFTITIFDKGGKTAYRELTIQCKKALTLYNIDFVIACPKNLKNFIFYKSFINAPTAAFLRCEKNGFYTGAENPFFTAFQRDNNVIVSYKPSLILKEGEIYTSEPQFLGAYKSTQEYTKEREYINLEAMCCGVKRSRFFNPCGEIALDYAEINVMREYVWEYYNVISKQFNNILYFFFYPKKQLPQTEKEVKDYLSTIDRFCQIEGDMIAFNPHVNTTIPTKEKPYWELAPQNSAAEKILHYAQERGLSCGYYMGCAFNGNGGNAALLPFMPEKTEWKKRDEFNNIAAENCLGCDEYSEWWYTVQANTIEKYNLGYWAWDPGPGNGNNCYASNHGHIPGQGEYKGWYNSQKLLKKLKDCFPSLFLMSFYGRKEYGIWGFRYFSQHEVYWEQTLLFGATLHNDLHDDRINSHGTRLQNMWCMNYRFLPADLGHGLVTRMGQSYFDPALDHACDFGGWRYSLLSAIACCGSVTHCNMPDNIENIIGYKEFYKKWIRWARDNYCYCKYTKPITDDVSNAVIDGFSRINKDKGQLFLFNSSPKIIKKSIVLNEHLGLDTPNDFYFNILYCENCDFEDKNVQYRGKYHMNDILEIVLPAYGALVLELSNIAGESIEQIPYNTHTIDKFVLPDNSEFVYPKHNEYNKVFLSAKTFVKKELKDVINKINVPNEDFLLKKIYEWKQKGLPFNFTSSLLNRLVLYIPFNGVKLPKSVKLFINSKQVDVETFSLRNTLISHYAFIEEYVNWDDENIISFEIEGLAENSFMGAYLDYPNACNGIITEEKIFDENNMPSRLYSDPSLQIESFSVTPDVLSDVNETITVTVKTNINPELIESVYFIHPTKPQMPALSYNCEEKVWQGVFSTGQRSKNIFCNSVITAWIKSKDGGIGPKAECRLGIKYTVK